MKRALIGLCLAATFAIGACEKKPPKRDGGPPPGAEAVDTTVAPVVPGPASQPAASDGPDQSELSNIAANIARDPTLGVFVATNREPLNRAVKSFSDQRSNQLTYGVAYQAVAATSTGVRPAKDLSFEFAGAEQFYGHINARAAEAVRYPKHVVVFVHGFNQTPPQAMTSAIAIRSLLRFDGPFVLFMWPSVGTVRNYGTDRLNAEVSDRAFLQMLCRLATRDDGAKVTVLAHSMGSYLTTNTLSNFRAHCPSASRLNALVMFSPDLPVSVLEARVDQVLETVGSATAYVSEYDLAVTSSEAVWDVRNFGLVHDRLPTVIPGIVSINVSDLQLGPFDLQSLSHDSYAYTQVMDDVFHLLRDGRVDPTLRSNRVQAMKRKDNNLVFYIMDGAAKGR